MFKESIYREELYNYIQIVEGHLFPESYLTSKNKVQDQDLITKSNKFEITLNKSISEARLIIHEIDFTRLGYKQLDDVQVDMASPDNDEITKIVIIPKTNYNDKYIENQISQIENPVTRAFTLLISDEYERIKTRSLRTLNLLPSDKVQ
jgi:hypothetical protein